MERLQFVRRFTPLWRYMGRHSEPSRYPNGVSASTDPWAMANHRLSSKPGIPCSPTKSQTPMSGGTEPTRRSTFRPALLPNGQTPNSSPPLTEYSGIFSIRINHPVRNKTARNVPISGTYSTFSNLPVFEIGPEENRLLRSSEPSLFRRRVQAQLCFCVCSCG